MNNTPMIEEKGYIIIAKSTDIPIHTVLSPTDLNRAEAFIFPSNQRDELLNSRLHA